MKNQLTPEELKNLQEKMQKFNAITGEMGALTDTKLDIEMKILDLRTDRHQVKNELDAIGETFREKYGDVNIDLTTGSLSPVE